VISQDPVPRELDVFDWLTELQACALDAVLPIVPSEAVVIAASILAAKGELSIWLVALAAAAGGFLGDTGSYLLGRTAGAHGAFDDETANRSRQALGRATSWPGGSRRWTPCWALTVRCGADSLDVLALFVGRPESRLEFLLGHSNTPVAVSRPQ